MTIELNDEQAESIALSVLEDTLKRLSEAEEDELDDLWDLIASFNKVIAWYKP